MPVYFISPWDEACGRWLGFDTSNRSKGAGQLMMIAQIFIALVAGSASALMFASIKSGALISLVLFNFAPLPLLVAALGWGRTTALVAAIVPTLAIGAFLDLQHMLVFAVTVALPACWLGHLALLAKPIGDSATATPTPPALEWYPAGHLLAWAAAFASLTTIAALLTFGFSSSAIADGLRQSLTLLLATAGVPAGVDSDKLVTMLTTVLPVGATMIATMTLALNLWLAGRITLTSGLLPRPWPVLKTIELPVAALVALSIAVVLCFAGGLLALISRVVAAALLVGYAFTGFAVLHTLTQAVAMRGLWLGGTYMAVAIFQWPLLVISMIGIADAIFGFRKRKARQLGPPTISS